METVSISRTIDAPPDRVREVMLDLDAFMRAADFDEVVVTDASVEGGIATGGTIEIGNAVGLFRIDLSLAVIEVPGAVLAYEQREGIFETMRTEYRLSEAGDATTVTATTEFALDAPFVGPLFDATVVTRQRRREIENQFDHLQAVCP